MDYPYLVSNKNIPTIIEKIRIAAKPNKFTIAFVKQLGLTSSNDQAYPSLLKKLGFLLDDGTPTAYYDSLRDEKTSKIVLAERIKELYSEMFAINTNINESSDSDIKGAISRITGKDSKDVNRIAKTFKILCENADFKNTLISEQVNVKENEAEEKTISTNTVPNIEMKGLSPDFHYNIQIHLPATTDISVYNAIFKSLKENLF